MSLPFFFNKIDITQQCATKLRPKGPYSFEFARTRYVIPAWYVQEDTLLRIIRLGDRNTDIFVAEIKADNEVETTNLDVDIYGARQLDSDDIEGIRTTLNRCLRLEDPINNAVFEIAKADRIVAAALNHRGRNRGKLYPNLFEALCGVICGQRISFARLPTMMGRMAKQTAPSVRFGGHTYAAFPNAGEIIDKGEEVLRNCGLGFRSKRIFLMAKAWQQKNFGELQDLPLSELRDHLVELPGVGPYTANLALTLTTGKYEEPHIDSFVCTLIGTFYYGGSIQTEKETLRFVKEHWGLAAEPILGILTTDTEEWAAPLGFDLPVRSGAKAKYHEQRGK